MYPKEQCFMYVCTLQCVTLLFVLKRSTQLDCKLGLNFLCDLCSFYIYPEQEFDKLLFS